MLISAMSRYAVIAHVGVFADGDIAAPAVNGKGSLVQLPAVSLGARVRVCCSTRWLRAAATKLICSTSASADSSQNSFQ